MPDSPEFVSTLTIIDNASKVLESIEASAKRAAGIFDTLIGVEKRFNSVSRPIMNVSDEMAKMADKTLDTSRAVDELNESLGNVDATAKKLSIGDAFKGILSNSANIFGAVQMASGFVDRFQAAVSKIDANTNMIARLGQVARNEGIAMEDKEAWQGRAEEIRKMLSKQATDLGLNATEYANNAITFANNPAFKGIEEASRFSELMSKQFFASGVGGQAQMSVINQLTQGLSKGKLQGEDLMSILSNAPDIGKLLEESYARLNNIDIDSVTGKVRELATDGKITAEVIKEAFFGAADKIEANFEEMPNTFEDMLTKFRNTVLESFQPLMQLIAKIGNSDEFKSMLNSFSSIIESFVRIADVLSPLLEVAMTVASKLMEVGSFWIEGILSPFSWIKSKGSKESPTDKIAIDQRSKMLQAIQAQTELMRENTDALQALTDLQQTFNERTKELYSYSDAFQQKTEDYLKNYQKEHVEAAVQEHLRQNPNLDNLSLEMLREGYANEIAQGNIFNAKQYEEARKVFVDANKSVNEFDVAIEQTKQSLASLNSAIISNAAAGTYSNMGVLMEQRNEFASMLSNLERNRDYYQSQLNQTSEAMTLYQNRMQEWLKLTAENTGKTARNTHRISINRDDLLFMRNIATAQIINNYNNNTNTANFNQSFGSGSPSQVRKASSDGFNRALRGSASSIAG